MSLLALIPARIGSKGILKKNIKLLSGKPLIAWTIEAAKKTKYIDRIVVSTDDIEISNIAKNYGAEVSFIRPRKLATDKAASIDVVLHAIQNLPKFDWIVLLQPTSPLRTPSDIDGIFDFCLKNKAVSAVSVSESLSHPYWIFKKDKSSRLTPFISNRPKIFRRQDLPKTYTLNGSLYLAKVKWILKHKSFVKKETLGYVMTHENSLDIDTLEDWKWAEYLIKKN